MQIFQRKDEEGIGWWWRIVNKYLKHASRPTVQKVGSDGHRFSLPWRSIYSDWSMRGLDRCLLFFVLKEDVRLYPWPRLLSHSLLGNKKRERIPSASECRNGDSWSVMAADLAWALFGRRCTNNNHQL